MYQKANRIDSPTHHYKGHQNGWGGVSCIEAQELYDIGTTLTAVVLIHEATATTHVAQDFLEWLRSGAERMLWMMNDSIKAKCQDV